MRHVSRATVIAGVVFIALSPAVNDVHAATSGVTLARPPAATLAVTATHRLVLGINQLVARSRMTLTASIETLEQDSGGSVGVTPVELRGSAPLAWSYKGNESFT